jgi:hypothetical protein
LAARRQWAALAAAKVREVLLVVPLMLDQGKTRYGKSLIG